MSCESVYHIISVMFICIYHSTNKWMDGWMDLVVLVVHRFGVGLVIERSLVRLPAGALSSQLGQLSLPSLRGR